MVATVPPKMVSEMIRPLHPVPFTLRASLLILNAFINSNKVSSPPSLLLKMRQKTLRIPNGLIGVEGVDTTRIRRTRGRGSTCYAALLSINL